MYVCMYVCVCVCACVCACTPLPPLRLHPSNHHALLPLFSSNYTSLSRPHQIVLPNTSKHVVQTNFLSGKSSSHHLKLRKKKKSHQKKLPVLLDRRPTYRCRPILVDLPTSLALVSIPQTCTSNLLFGHLIMFRILRYVLHHAYSALWLWTVEHMNDFTFWRCGQRTRQKWAMWLVLNNLIQRIEEKMRPQILKYQNLKAKSESLVSLFVW